MPKDLEGERMFIQICSSALDTPSICCRLSDLSPEDGERFMLSIDGLGMDTEVGISQDDATRSTTAKFSGLMDGEVYTVNAYADTGHGWEKIAFCKAVPAKLPAAQSVTVLRKVKSRAVQPKPLPPAVVVLEGTKGNITSGVEKMEVW